MQKWNNEKSIDSFCAAAEFFNVRTHPDLRQPENCSQQCMTLAIETIRKTADTICSRAQKRVEVQKDASDVFEQPLSLVSISVNP